MTLNVIQLRPVAAPRRTLVPSVIAPLVEANTRGNPLDPVVRETVRVLGFDSFTFSFANALRPTKDTPLFVYTTTEHAWVDLYARKSYVDVDPRLRAVENTWLPETWDTESMRGQSARCDAFLDDAARFGIASGVVVAQHGPRQDSMVLMFNSRAPRIDSVWRLIVERRISDLVIFGQYLSALYIQQHREDIEPDGDELTERETEVLLWVAHGLTGAGIGRRLGITERTVQGHLDSAKVKLGASNRQQAVAHALRRGLIVVNG